jgi:hypothetical protein
MLLRVMRKKKPHYEAINEALILARSGTFRDVREVERALKARLPETFLPLGRVERGLIDGICFRSRRQKKWDT